MPLTIAVVALIATLTRLVSALEDVRALRLASELGIVSSPDVARLLARAGVRRELWRIVKHALTIGIISYVYTIRPALPQVARSLEGVSWMVAMIGVSLMANSVFDYFVQRRAIANYLPAGIDSLQATGLRRKTGP